MCIMGCCASKEALSSGTEVQKAFLSPLSICCIVDSLWTWLFHLEDPIYFPSLVSRMATISAFTKSKVKGVHHFPDHTKLYKHHKNLIQKFYHHLGLHIYCDPFLCGDFVRRRRSTAFVYSVFSHPYNQSFPDCWGGHMKCIILPASGLTILVLLYCTCDESRCGINACCSHHSDQETLHRGY